MSENRIYSITLPNLELNDTTGIGDIFCAAFGCTMLKEKDILWALSFGGGAAQAALESRQIGLEKIPSKGAIESNAYYFYNSTMGKGEMSPVFDTNTGPWEYSFPGSVQERLIEAAC